MWERSDLTTSGLGWCENIGLPRPTDRDLAWLEGGEQ